MGPDDQSASLQGDAAAIAPLITHEETRVVAGQIVAVSPRQWTCSKHLEHPVVLGREEHRRTRTNFQLPRSGSV